MDFRAPQIQKMVGFRYLLVGDDGVKEEEESRVIHLGVWSDRVRLWGRWSIVAGIKFGGHSEA